MSDDDDPYDEREEDMRIGKKRVSSHNMTFYRRSLYGDVGNDNDVYALLTD